MGLKMSEKESLARENAVRYAKAGKKQKSKILDEFCATTGHNRKYATAKLNGLVEIRHASFNGRKTVSVKLKEKRTTKNRGQNQKRRRAYPKKYGEDVKKSLTKIWLYFHMMCGQRLVVIIRENIDRLACESGFEITADVRKKLEEISSATLDRLLKDARKKYKHIRGASTTKAPSNLSQIIPVRTHYTWNERAPRFFETDTVSNDGDTSDIEAFAQSIGVLDKTELTKIKQALEDYKVLYNVARLQGFDEITEKIDINTVKALVSEVERAIFNKNFSSSLVDSADTQALLNTALDEIKFNFTKIGEEELTIADKWQETAEKTRKAFTRNLDPKDPEYISLFEELKRVMAKKNIEELTASDMRQSIKELEELRKKIEQKNQKDQTLCNKYNGDAKFMRIHKRMKETPPPLIPSDTLLHQVLLNIKSKTDNLLLTNSNVINNEAYFDGQLKAFVIPELQQQKVTFTLPQVVNMTKLIENEYFAERAV